MPRAQSARYTLRCELWYELGFGVQGLGFKVYRV